MLFLRRSLTVRTLFGGVAACVFLAGFGATTESAPVVAHGPARARDWRQVVRAPHGDLRGAPSWMSPEVRTGSHLIYWGDANNGDVVIFPAKGINPKPIGKIAGVLQSPGRLFVDKALNLYVADDGTSSVLVYKPGSKSPSLTITDGVDAPTGLVVDSAGNVYCANILNSTITEYPPGQTSPSRTLQLNVSPENLALDKHENLYVVYQGHSGSGVMRIRHGSTVGKDLGLEVVSASAVEVDRAGNIIVADGGTHSIDIFRPGAKKPSKQVAVALGSPAELALNRTERAVYVTVALPNYRYIVEKLRYPDGTALEKKITRHLGQFPIAVSPDTVF